MAARNTKLIRHKKSVFEVDALYCVYHPNGQVEYKRPNGTILRFNERCVTTYRKPRAQTKKKKPRVQAKKEKAPKPAKTIKYRYHMTSERIDLLHRGLTRKERNKLIQMLVNGADKRDMAKVLGKRIEMLDWILAPHYKKHGN